MKKSVVVLAPLVAALFVFACDDSSGGSSSGDFTVDSGGFDSGGGSSSGDAFVPVNPDDGPVNDHVTVSLIRGIVGVSGATVVFHDTTGAVVESKTTDANGTASSTPGMAVAQASVVYLENATGARQHIVTWTSVAAGDQLVARANDFVNPAGSIAVTGAAYTGAAGYTNFVGDCEAFGPTLPVTVPLDQSCVYGTDAVLSRADDTNGNYLAYAFAKNVMAPSAIAATVGVWAAPATANLVVSGIPSGDVIDDAFLTQIANDMPFRFAGTIGKLPTDAITFSVPGAGFADAYQYSIREGGSGGATHTFAQRAAAPTSLMNISATLPSLASVTLTTTNTPRPQLDWTTQNNVSLATAAGGVATIDWYDQSENSFSWTFIVPPGSKGVVAPMMPAAVNASLPTATSTFNRPSVSFGASPQLTDYADFRGLIGVVLPLGNTATALPIVTLPIDGAIELTTYQDLPL